VSGLVARAVLTGGAVGLALLSVPIGVAAAAFGTEADSPLWLIVTPAFVVAFVAAGVVAARRSPAAPARHGAAAGGAALVVVFTFAVLRNLVTGGTLGAASVVTIVFALLFGTSLAIVGGVLATRQRRRGLDEGELRA